MNFWDIVCKKCYLPVSNIPVNKIFLLFPSGYNHQYCRGTWLYRQSCRSPRDMGYKKSIHHFLLDMYSLGKCNTNMRLRHLLAMMHYTFPPGNSSPPPGLAGNVQMPHAESYAVHTTTMAINIFFILNPHFCNKKPPETFRWLAVQD